MADTSAGARPSPSPATAGLSIPGLTEPVLLARGGYATIFRATQGSIGRDVAVKVENRALESDRDRDRFMREARAAGRMSSHPHVVDLFDAGVTDGGHPYLVMELCQGSYAERMRHSPMTAAEACDMGEKIAGALTHAHERGVLHRDVKPANILTSDFGEPVLADFGLAVIAEHRDLSVTLDTMTPAYAPPEMFDNAEPSPAGDVYALCATLYALIQGRPARWPQDSPPSLMALLDLFDEPIPDLPGSDPLLMDLLRAGMAVDPDTRPAVEEVRQVLASVAHNGGPPKPRPRPGSVFTPRPTASTTVDTPTEADVSERIAGERAAGGHSAGERAASRRDVGGAGVGRPADDELSVTQPAGVDSDTDTPDTDPEDQRSDSDRVDAVGRPGAAAGWGEPVSAPERSSDPDGSDVAASGPARSRWFRFTAGAVILAALFIGVRWYPRGEPAGGAVPPGQLASEPVRSAVDGDCVLPRLVGAQCMQRPECYGNLAVDHGVATAPTVTCDQPHTWEAFAVADLPDGVTADYSTVRADARVRAVCNQLTLALIDRSNYDWDVEVLPEPGAHKYHCLAGRGTGKLNSPHFAGQHNSGRGHSG